MARDTSHTSRIGIAGTGFVARHLARLIHEQAGLEPSLVLTRRHDLMGADFEGVPCTGDHHRLIEASDLIVACSGDLLQNAVLITEAVDADCAIVTVDPSFHLIAGSLIAGQGQLSEVLAGAAGRLFQLIQSGRAMGLTVAAGALAVPMTDGTSLGDAACWAHHKGISVPSALACLDGTLTQLALALVANAAGCDLLCEGGFSPVARHNDEAMAQLAEAARAHGRTIVDQILVPEGQRTTAMIVGSHASDQCEALAHHGFGEGPLCHLERTVEPLPMAILATIDQLLRQGGNSLRLDRTPAYSVAAIAKEPLAAGTRFAYGVGSLSLKGETVRTIDHPNHLPIGLAQGVVLTKTVEQGELLSLENVELPDSLAADAWMSRRGRVIAEADITAQPLTDLSETDEVRLAG
ncbi:MAG: hypothetical protein ACFB6S_09740 [Geminicoccaceae bacterium]